MGLYPSFINVGETGDRLRVRDAIVDIVPMGLPDDHDLAALGILSHAMEDYLIKLLLSDGPLRRDVPEFRQLLEQLIEVIRRHDLPFDSSKELFQLVKPVIKRGFSDTRLVVELFQRADGAILQSVMSPVTERLERAVTT